MCKTGAAEQSISFAKAARKEVVHMLLGGVSEGAKHLKWTATSHFYFIY